MPDQLLSPPRRVVVQAWLDLRRRIIEDPPPCTADPEAWTGEDLDLDAAAYGCWRCPALAECGRYAELARESHGVWAAVVRGRPGRARRLPPDPIDPPTKTPGRRGQDRRQRHHPRDAECPTGGPMVASAPPVRPLSGAGAAALRPASAHTAEAAGTQPSQQHQPERTPNP